MSAGHSNEWNVGQIPDLSGRTAVVTGANSGIGFETAIALSHAGAVVVIASRSEERGAAAAARIQSSIPKGEVVAAALDLASLDSIASFSRRLEQRVGKLDLLVNNAGVMTPPKRGETADGFELQLGTNHLGHFALTGHLLGLLRSAEQPRVVTLSSLMHWFGKIDFEDLQGLRYSPDRAYAQSKLANLMFARQLQRESDQHRWGITSVAAHPGIARTELVASGPGTASLSGRINALIIEPLFSQSAATGALPSLLAATASDVRPGGYYGPSHSLGMNGPPGEARLSNRAKDHRAASRLWAVSQELTGLEYR